jgi:aspartate racemase
VDFEPIKQLQHVGDWAGTAMILAKAAQSIEAAGAEFLVICTNTMHIVAPQIEAAIGIPILHIADATAEVLLAAGVGTVGLLGTAFTMEEDFYKGRLTDKFGLQVVTPNAADRKIVHDVIYQELCLGSFEESARQEYVRIIDELAAQGAEAVILGCTEIGMLVKQSDTPVMLCDTTAIHAAKAVEYALESD